MEPALSRSRTRVRRLPEKQVQDRAALDALLDAALVAHVAVPQQHRLAVVPVGMARDRDRLLIHGSTASQAFRTLAGGVQTCATVTLLEGVVVARSQFESSMQYRCAMLYGAFEPIPDGEKAAALAVLAAALLPGLTGPRAPSRKELKATSVLALPLADRSLTVSRGDVAAAEADLDRPAWAGLVPLEHRWGAAVSAPGIDLEPPAELAGWPVRG